MNRTKIEWVRNEDGSQGYTANPVKGYCPMACPYCYARRLYDRFGWDKTIRFNQLELLYGISKIRDKHPKIFVGSTIELFGDWVKDEFLTSIFQWVSKFNWCTFIFLTKQPHNLVKWTFPENCWVGVSVDGTDNAPLGRMLYTGFHRVKATVKFISFEPLLADPHLDYRDLTYDFGDIQWVIVGQQTPVNNKTRPKPDWIREILNACNSSNVPIFIKDNIIDDATMDLRLGEMRQEFPNVR